MSLRVEPGKWSWEYTLSGAVAEVQFIGGCGSMVTWTPKRGIWIIAADGFDGDAKPLTAVQARELGRALLIAANHEDGGPLAKVSPAD